jgi:hypothetical protein
VIPTLTDLLRKQHNSVARQCRASLLYHFYKFEYLVIGKVFNIRFIVDGEQVNGAFFEQHMGNHPCAARFAFSLTGNGKAYFIAVMANGSAFFRPFLQLVNKRLQFIFKGMVLPDQPPGLPFKNGYGLNVKAH